MKKLLFLFVTSLFILSCSNDDTTEATQEPMEFEVLLKNSFASTPITPSPHGVVIKNQNELDELYAMISAEFFTNGFFPENDFSTHYILYMIDGPKPDSSYSLNVSTIYENANSIDVNAISSSVDEPAATVPMQPFTIVRIPKTVKPVNFNFN